MKIKIISLSILFVILLIIILPKVLIKNNSNLSIKEISCANRDAITFLGSPFERLITIKTAVISKSNSYNGHSVEDDVFIVNAYTIAGIKYASVELICDEQARRI